MASAWDKYTVEELTGIAEGWQDQFEEAKKALESSELSPLERRAAFRRKKDAEAALQELLGWTEHTGEFVLEYIAKDGTRIGHWTENIFHKGIIQKRMEEPQKLMEESNLGSRFKGRTFASFDAKRDRAAFDACSEYANDDFLMQKDRNGLLLVGGYGSGKTHLAAAISSVLISKGVPVLFGTSTSHLENLRSEIDNTQQKTYLSKMKVTPVLVIDDLGKEKKSEWTQQVLFDVVNYRYEHKLPLIITTNLASDGNYDDLANYVEGAVYSRLCEMCDTVETKASDYRQR